MGPLIAITHRPSLDRAGLQDLERQLAAAERELDEPRAACLRRRLAWEYLCFNEYESVVRHAQRAAASLMPAGRRPPRMHWRRRTRNWARAAGNVEYLAACGYAGLHRWDEAYARYDAARRLTLLHPAERARVLTALAATQHEAGEADRARRTMRRSRLARWWWRGPAHDRAHRELLAAKIEADLGRPRRAARTFRRAIRSGAAARCVKCEAAGRVGLGLQLSALHAHAESAAQLATATAMLGDSDHSVALVGALRSTAISYAAAGAPREAAAAARSAATQGRAVGDLAGEATDLAVCARYEGDAGDELAAKRTARLAADVIRRIEDRHVGGSLLYDLAKTERRLGLRHDAKAHLRRLGALGVELGANHPVFLANAELAEILLEEGRAPEAIQALERATATAISDDDRADVLTTLAEVYEAEGKPTSAANCRGQARALRGEEVPATSDVSVVERRPDGTQREIPRGVESVRALIANAAQHLDEGNPREALGVILLAWQLAESGVVTPPSDRARLLNVLGLSHLALSSLHEAERSFTQALTAAREAGENPPWLLANHARALRLLGREKEGAAVLRTALDVSTDPETEGALAVRLGDGYVRTSHYEQALNAYARAVHALLESGSAEALADVHAKRYALLNRLGVREDADRAAEFAFTRLDDVRSAPLRETLLRLRASHALVEGRLADARRDAEAAIAAAPGGTPNARTLVEMGRCCHHEGDLGTARRWHEEALQVAEREGDRFELGGALHWSAALLYDAGDHAEAAEHFARSAAILDAVGSEHGALASRLGEANARAASDDDDAAVETAFRSAAELAERQRGRVHGSPLRRHLFASLVTTYSAYARWLAAHERLEEALEQADTARARAFLDAHPAAPGAVRDAPQVEKLMAQLAAARRRALSDAPTRRIKARLEVGRLREQLYGRTDAGEPAGTDLALPPAWNWETIAAELLDEHTALLEFVLDDEESGLMLVTDEVRVFAPLPPRAKIDRLVRELVAGLILGWPGYLNGHELYRMLLGEVEPFLGDRDLLIVPDGLLHELPFSLLLTEPVEAPLVSVPELRRSPRRREGDLTAFEEVAARVKRCPEYEWQHLPYLVRQRAVSYVPSLLAASLLRRRARARPASRRSNGIAAFAVPLDRAAAAAAVPWAGRLGTLPGTLREVHAATEVLRQAGRVVVETSARATKSAVLDTLAGDEEAPYRYVLFSCHGIRDDEFPELGGLVLTPESADIDCVWRAYEIAGLSLPCDHVTLSACVTGAGPGLPGEGVISLGRAFLLAGATCATVSLWNVDDVLAMDLVGALHVHLGRGEPPARALRSAQLAAIEEGDMTADPASWAVFATLGVPAPDPAAV